MLWPLLRDIQHNRAQSRLLDLLFMVKQMHSREKRKSAKKNIALTDLAAKGEANMGCLHFVFLVEHKTILLNL